MLKFTTLRAGTNNARERPLNGQILPVNGLTGQVCQNLHRWLDYALVCRRRPLYLAEPYAPNVGPTTVGVMPWQQGIPQCKVQGRK